MLTDETVDVLLFAGLRTAAGMERIRVQIPAGTLAADLPGLVASQYPALADQTSSCRVALDLEFAAPDRLVLGSREIALIPPVSGGHDGPRQDDLFDGRVLITGAKLSLEDAIACVTHHGAGALCSFVGQVRGVSQQREVAYLEYEAYIPMCQSHIAEVIRNIEAMHPGVQLAIQHRLGRVEVGEAAVVIVASSPHRSDAFAACRLAIEALKADAPIWKREYDGAGGVWLGRGS